MNNGELKNPPFHPIAEIFPLMVGEPFERLCEDIKVNGLHNGIWIYKGQIIDGRNRYLACKKMEVRPEFWRWTGEEKDLVPFVVSQNILRRHLSESQRAMIAAKIATRMPRQNCAADKKQPGINLAQVIPPSCGQAAEMLNISKGTVKIARQVRAKGIPEVVCAVESGTISVHAAKQIAGKPVDEQLPALKARCDEASREPKSSKGGNGIIPKTRKVASRKAPEAIRAAIGTLVGLATGLDSFSVKDAAPTAEEAAEWERELSNVISSINRLRRELKACSHV